MALLELEVMRFADSYASLESEAVDDFIANASTSHARIAGVKWKLGQATAAYIDATGPNAALNALDLVVLATASRMVVEDYGMEVFGEAALPVLATQRRLQTNAWDMVDRLLKPNQQKELMDMIDAWRQQNPEQRHVGAIRFRELATAVGKEQQIATPPPNSVFSLLFLNPLSGLDPTALAIQETRQLAERAMYYSQRMPTLLNWQVQLLSLELANQPEITQILSDTERLTRSTEAFARIADQLPKLVNDQREAAINQILVGLAAERTNLLAGFAAEEQKARALLAETRETLNAGSQMAVSVNTTVQSLDAFIRSVSQATNRPADSTNSKPFNVLDYGAAASQVGTAAKDLGAMLTTVNETTPQLARLRQDATVDAQRVVQHAFWLGLVLILILLVGSVVAGLAYRVLAARLTPAYKKPRANALSEPPPT
ncbi:MAG: hypothetical protein NT154_26875, partial [Verrucomicrobia bacterium]|nr:hypothetical protein [Verrucomicrobiota bacterium]